MTSYAHFVVIRSPSLRQYLAVPLDRESIENFAIKFFTIMAARAH
jgi:hypothetical protein